jgi:hypothetical protein
VVVAAAEQRPVLCIEQRQPVGGHEQQAGPLYAVPCHGRGEGDDVRHTEFWARLDRALGPAYSRSWAEQQVIPELEGRTVLEALEAGETPKRVWRAVWATLELPASER